MWLARGKRVSPKKEEEYDELVSVCRKDYFPYLDMKLVWSNEEELQFQVYMKPNQQLKYLNNDSTHTYSCFKAIPNGVYKRLAKLTTMTEGNANKTLKEIYPHHFKSLELANLVTGDIPTLKEEIQKREKKTGQTQTESQSNQTEKEGQRKEKLLLRWILQNLENTNPQNNHSSQKEAQPQLAQSLNVFSQIHQSERDTSRRSHRENNAWNRVNGLHGRILQLPRQQNRQMQLQQHLQAQNSSV